MRFCHVTLTVKDMDASIRFYTEVVGLPIVSRYQAGAGMEIAFLGEGETKVELICNANSYNAVVGSAMSIGFEVESVPDKLNCLKHCGVPTVSDIVQPNASVRFFYAADPDGFRVQFLEHM